MRAGWVFLLAATLAITAHLRDRFDTWVDATRLPPLLAETSVEVLDRNDALLRAYTVEDGRWRLAVAPQEVSGVYIDMLLAYEDKRFWTHPGVDLRALIRASGQAIRHGRIVSGGSTLTMQVARLMENSGTGRVPGKLRQIRVALALERKLTKEQILGLYLLHAPFGGNLEGVRAASLAYFGKPPKHLSSAEAALLVALPQAPESRRPDLYPDYAAKARAKVLRRMQALGKLSEVETDRAMAGALPASRKPMPLIAAHLTDRAHQNAPLQKTHNLTIDASLQSKTEALARGRVHAAGRALSAAIMVLDHQTGDILVSMGAPDLNGPAGHVDMTRALRSPGSTLKPLVYALAYDTGRAHPLSTITDAPVRFGEYAPANFDDAYRGDITLDDALRLSLNTPVVQLTEMISPARLVASMREAGMRPELSGAAPGLAVALGGVGVTLEDLVRLYGGIARGGVAIDPVWSAHGQPTGNTRRFMSDRSAWHIAKTLARLPPPPGMPQDRLAYKTGTSYGHRDAWSIGFDGRHVIGVWIGRPDGTAVPGIFGADLAAPLMFEVAQIVSAEPASLPNAPKGVAAWRAADLPAHLRHVGRGTATDQTRLKVAFPPDGARLAREEMTLKLANGKPPFTILLNNAPISVQARVRAIPITLDGPGFHRLTALDASGQAVSVDFSLR